MHSAEREWLDLIADVLSEPLVEMPVELLALQMVDTFRAAGCAYSAPRPEQGASQQQLYPRDEDFHGHRAAIESLSGAEVLAVHPILRHYRAVGRADLVIQVADVPAASWSENRSEWFDLSRGWGASHQLSLPLETAAVRAFVVGRDRPFSERELALAHLVQRLARGLERQVDAFASPGCAVVAESVGLTPREGAVLALLADGHTAAAIARRLNNSERTVHKHLQRIYIKIGVSDRLAAAYWARSAGLGTPVPVDGGGAVSAARRPARAAAPAVPTPRDHNSTQYAQLRTGRPS